MFQQCDFLPHVKWLLKIIRVKSCPMLSASGRKFEIRESAIREGVDTEGLYGR